MLYGITFPSISIEFVNIKKRFQISCVGGFIYIWNLLNWWQHQFTMYWEKKYLCLVCLLSFLYFASVALTLTQSSYIMYGEWSYYWNIHFPTSMHYIFDLNFTFSNLRKRNFLFFFFWIKLFHQIYFGSSRKSVE